MLCQGRERVVYVLTNIRSLRVAASKYDNVVHLHLIFTEFDFLAIVPLVLQLRTYSYMASKYIIYP